MSGSLAGCLQYNSLDANYLSAQAVHTTTNVYVPVRVMETTAHHPFHNSNRSRGEAAGPDDAVAALDRDLDHQLLEQRLALTGRYVLHGVADCLFRTPRGLVAGASTLFAESRTSTRERQLG